MLAQKPRLQVLLVDDEDSLRRALARTIDMAGFDVQAFASVEALMESGIPARDAVLVLDVGLPGVGGVEFKQSLVEAGRDIPTIFITAHAAADVSESLAALSPVAVLYKPFNGSDLLNAIRQAATLN